MLPLGDLSYDDGAALEGEYQRIVENLRRRYVVSYTSTNAKRNGAWRAVTIESQAPHTIVRSRGGYYAPTFNLPAGLPRWSPLLRR